MAEVVQALRCARGFPMLEGPRGPVAQRIEQRFPKPMTASSAPASVKVGPSDQSVPFPLFPQNQTFVSAVGTSVRCQKRTPSVGILMS